MSIIAFPLIVNTILRTGDDDDKYKWRWWVNISFLITDLSQMKAVMKEKIAFLFIDVISVIRVNLVYLNTEGTNLFWGFYFERLWSDLHSHASPTFMTSPCALTWAVVGKCICQNRNHRLGVAAMFTSVRTEPRVEPLDAASLRQQRRLKQALQFLHRDSADLLPLDGLKKLGTAKQGVCCRPGGDTLTFIQTV